MHYAYSILPEDCCRFPAALSRNAADWQQETPPYYFPNIKEAWTVHIQDLFIYYSNISSIL